MVIILFGNKKRITGLLFSFIIILILIFFIIVNLSKNEKKPLLIPVKIAASKAILTVPVLIAYHNSYFEDQGLDVIMDDSYSSGKTAFEAMLKNKADVSTVATTPIVANSFHRDDFSIFGCFTTTYEGVKIIAFAEQEKQQYYSLTDKRIGVVKGTISELLLHSYLAYEKISINEVEVVYISANEASEKMLNKEVDVVCIWDPYASQILGMNSVAGFKVPSAKVYRMAISMASENDFAIKNPEILQKIMKSLNEAVLFINENRGEAILITAELLELDAEFISVIWDEYDFNISLDQLLLRTMESEALWFIQNVFIQTTEMPNYLDFLNTAPLDSTFPDVNKIIRKD